MNREPREAQERRERRSEVRNNTDGPGSTRRGLGVTHKDSEFREPPVDRRETRSEIVGASGLNVLLGIWLIIAPFVLVYADVEALWNDIIVGIIIAVLAGVRISGVFGSTWLSWVNFVLGLWLVIAPFVLGYLTGRALWNDVIVGITVAALAVWSVAATRRQF